jgi:hypothetical protein
MSNDLEVLKIVCSPNAPSGYAECHTMLQQYIQHTKEDHKTQVMCPIECTHGPDGYTFGLWFLLVGCLIYIFLNKRW